MKVLIADDELPIREWLKFTMRGISEEFEILTAGNGKDAWELVLKENPELIVTDIKMPRMDGLELLQKIKERDAGAYVVMLTSYGEFAYAREAIKYQANEYVLKNEITSEVLIRILESFYKKREFRDGMQKVSYVKDLLEKGKLNPEMTEERTDIQVFGVAFEDLYQGQESFESYLNSFVESIDQYFYEEGVSIWVCRCKKLTSMAASFQEAMSFCQRLSCLRESSVGFSGFCSSIKESCVRARKALNSDFYEERNCVYSYEPENGENIARFRVIRKQIVTYLRQGRNEEAIAAVEELFEEIEKRKSQELEEVYICFQDLIDACKVANMEFAGDELEELCKKYKKEIRRTKKCGELKRIIRQFFEKLEGSMLIEQKQYSKYVKSAIKYVSDNYATIESLAEVAGYVNLNAEYFCRIFKAEVGQTFNSYLTQYRIKKAIELLNRTELKVYEIAERVGYPNLSYFSRVFKKITGETPFSYKN